MVVVDSPPPGRDNAVAAVVVPRLVRLQTLTGSHAAHFAGAASVVIGNAHARLSSRVTGPVAAMVVPFVAAVRAECSSNMPADDKYSKKKHASAPTPM